MDNSYNWDKILNLIKSKIDPGNYRIWFSKTKIGPIDQQSITLYVPSAFIKEQLIKRYQNLIEEAIHSVLNSSLTINYQVDPSLESKLPIDEADAESFMFQPQTSPQKSSPLNPKSTLENFVVGLTNNLAYAAAQAVVDNPGISYNPLFIYGPSGVGKTHLMQAIGNAILQKNPSSKLVFVPSEQFMVDFVETIQSKRWNEFRKKYRDCDLLLVDDIQFISGKDAFQEEFFHTFNKLHTDNAQIVLTSDRPPIDMAKLESRLVSRFQGGLMVDIQLPDFDTRMAILKAKLKERGEELPEDVLRQIADNTYSSTRELEGRLIQVIQKSKLTGQVSLDDVNQLINKTSPMQNALLDYKKVISVINHYFNIRTSDLIGPRRQKELVLPRQIAMYILYEDCRIPMEKIGDILGGRDHTTILHGIEKIRTNISEDKSLQKAINDVKNSLSI